MEQVGTPISDPLLLIKCRRMHELSQRPYAERSEVIALQSKLMQEFQIPPTYSTDQTRLKKIISGLIQQSARLAQSVN